MINLKMKNYNTISQRSSENISQEILPSDRNRIIDQVKFIYSPFRKAFEKQTNTIENQGPK